MNPKSEPLQIVLVEDNKGDVDLTREMLNATGIEHQLTWLCDGEKALRYFEMNESVDFILLDLNLPRFGGHRLMEIIHERGLVKDIPVITLTGSCSPEDRDRAFKNGVTSYLIKPMNIQEMDRISETLRELFHRRKRST